MALDSAGNVYVADTSNDTIRKITQVGTNWVTSTLAGLAGVPGSSDGTNSDARFSLPVGLAVDGAGNLYVGDNQNSTIRKITPVGTNWVVSTLAGFAGSSGIRDGTGSDARFRFPEGLAMDNTGNLYVADMGNDAIRIGRLGFSLQASLSGGQIILSWPTLASNFVLETTSSLVPSLWTPLTNGIGTSGQNFLLTNDAQVPTAFYRLHDQP